MGAVSSYTARVGCPLSTVGTSPRIDKQMPLEDQAEQLVLRNLEFPDQKSSFSNRSSRELVNPSDWSDSLYSQFLSSQKVKYSF